MRDTEKTQEVATETDHPPLGHGYFWPMLILTYFMLHYIFFSFLEPG